MKSGKGASPATRLAYYHALFARFEKYIEDGHPISLHRAHLDGSTDVTLRFQDRGV